MHGLGSPGADWLAATRRYLAVIAGGNLIWEAAQLPLYTLWREGSARSILSAVAHCTAGDLMIGSLALTAALIVVGRPNWPHERYYPVMASVVATGVGYTVFSEYLNTVVRRSWTYTEWMPTLPWFGTGVSPLLQWLVVPVLAIAWASRRGNVSQG